MNRTIGKDLLCIQDTSEYNYEGHKGSLKEGTLGFISDNRSLGLRVHPMLVLDNEDEFAYGFSSLEVINRAGKTLDRHERKYRSLPIEEKESSRWLDSIGNTKRLLNQANSLTFIADRESDIYELWSRVPDKKTHLVIRTSLFRIFENETGTSINPFDSSKRVGHMTLSVPGDAEKHSRAREAQLEIFVQKAWTRKPNRLLDRANEEPGHVMLYVVGVKEVVKKGDKITDPIEWILLTDIETENMEEAQRIVSVYKSRWNIEQIFRLTKKKGFGLEESQLETAHALENLIAMVFIAAVKVFQMVKSRNDESRPAIDIFDETQVELLKKINKGLEGKTDKSKNKFKPGTLAYFIWVIARLGKWKPEDRDPAGPITLLEGWLALHHYIQINRIVSG